ncbi:DUF4169 family protein [Sphingomonas sp. PAMC26645]|uniref:DUF4169 family protein n=1 Tax=Sphingomonas sp. PAMC26645 TaxID=2565555 RepID=UPI00109DFB06|nr:DUF4169 family protein [Sphingomonas sp. PAMC26645]QCB41215.1 DUF4169 family protein [Sphingomonas sp. PAMC26645]
MGEVINLRLARKQRARVDAAGRADQNRRVFGRTGAEKAADAAVKARLEATLDGARLESLAPDETPE